MAFVISYIYELASHLYESWIIDITFFFLVGCNVVIFIKSIKYIIQAYKEKGFEFKYLKRKVVIFFVNIYWLAAFDSAYYKDSSEGYLSYLFQWIVYLQEALYR